MSRKNQIIPKPRNELWRQNGLWWCLRSEVHCVDLGLLEGTLTYRKLGREELQTVGCGATPAQAFSDASRATPEFFF